jgi:hypothetical protein
MLPGKSKRSSAWKVNFPSSSLSGINPTWNELGTSLGQNLLLVLSYIILPHSKHSEFPLQSNPLMLTLKEIIAVHLTVTRNTLMQCEGQIVSYKM